MAKTENNAKNVPGALIAAVVVIIAIAAFVPTVYMPYKNKKPGMDEKHQEALDTIAYYDDSIARQSEIEADIAALTERWEKFQKDMFIDADSSLMDLNDALKDCDIVYTAFNTQDPTQDPSGTVTAEGSPLYYVAITITGTGSRENLLKFLKYVEEDSIGAYYVKTMNATPQPVLDDEGKETGDEEFKFTTQIYLYYFNQDITIVPEVVETDTDTEA